MGFFNFRKAAPVKEAEPKLSRAPRSEVAEFNIDSVATSQELMEFLRHGGSSHSGEPVTTKSALSVAAVYRCSAIIAGVIGGMPVKFKDEFTNVEEERHPLRRLLNRRPNQWQTGYEFKRFQTLAVLMRGNGYARKVWNGREVSSLIPLMPNRVRPEVRDDGKIEYIYTGKHGKEQKIAQEDMFHIRGMSIDGVNGVGVLEYAREAVAFSQATARHGQKLFRNGTRIGGALKHKETLSDDAYARLKASIAEFKVEGERFGGDLILEEGMEYDAFGMTSEDAEFVENRKFSVVEIAMFYGVPPHMIGLTEKSTSWGSGIEQQSIGFVNYTLNDWFEAWEGAIERDLLPYRSDLVADFDTYALLRGDETSRWESNRIKLEMGAYNTDEIRHAEGLPAKPDGSGQKFYSPPNVPQEDNSDVID